MGVLNVTPDSFSDGGRRRGPGAALAAAETMLAQGAALIDVGGESTRPGAEPVAEAEELDRAIPVVERLVSELGCMVSIDTMKPAVMRAACAAGAELINDVNALRAPGALAAACEAGAAVCLVHMQAEPRTMQAEPRYGDVVAEVGGFLRSRAEACELAGLARERICIDPGFGFGKRLEHNIALLAGLPALAAGRYPLMVGISRKSMLGELTGRASGERLAAGVAAAVLAAERGAVIVRTHDVAAAVDALKVTAAVLAR
ncbi:MAG: dihydropteroate synthase [Gammaproteobacteria bacterium]|nr:dihydropteroate synthase [Gammaproteobacteria bacterium]